MAPPIHVVLSDYVWKRKWWVYYLIVVDDFLDKNNIATTLPAEFENLTFQYAQDYIRNGKMPPADTVWRPDPNRPMSETEFNWERRQAGSPPK